MSRPDAAPQTHLLDAAASGDAAAWEALTEALLPELWATARSHGLDDAAAADVCRLVCVRLAQSLHELTRGDRLAWWLARTGREECHRAAAQATQRRAPVIDLRREAERRRGFDRRLAAGT